MEDLDTNCPIELMSAIALKLAEINNILYTNTILLGNTTPSDPANVTSKTYVDSDGVVNKPLEIALEVRKTNDKLFFDFSGSSLPCIGPMNSVFATTLSSVYLAIRHIFPEVPINGGAFDPLKVERPKNTFRIV